MINWNVLQWEQVFSDLWFFMFCSPSCCFFSSSLLFSGGFHHSTSIIPFWNQNNECLMFLLWWDIFWNENDASLLIYYIFSSDCQNSNIDSMCVFNQRPDGLQVWSSCCWLDSTNQLKSGVQFHCLLLIFHSSHWYGLLVHWFKFYKNFNNWKEALKLSLDLTFCYIFHPVAAGDGTFQLVFKGRVWSVGREETLELQGDPDFTALFCETGYFSSKLSFS